MGSRSFFDQFVKADEALRVAEPTPIGAGNAMILNISGHTDRLFALIDSAISSEQWDPSAVLSIGFRNVNGVPFGHLLIVVNEDQTSLNDLKATVSKSLFSGLLRDDFYYAHLLSAMGDEVNIGAFDKGFEHMVDSDQVFHLLFEVLYVPRKDHTEVCPLHGSRTLATSLILLGNTRKRVVVAAKAGDIDTFTRITTPTEGRARFATVDESAFAIAPYEGSRLYGVHVVQISLYLEGQVDRIEWRDTSVQGKILELAIVDGAAGKLLLTLEGCEYRYIPVDVRFTNNLLVLIADLTNATPFVAGSIQLPVVRINAHGAGGRGYLALVDRVGNTIVSYLTIQQLAEADAGFAKTARSVTNGIWQSTQD